MSIEIYVNKKALNNGFKIKKHLKCCANCINSVIDYGGGTMCKLFDIGITGSCICNKFQGIEIYKIKQEIE